MSAVQQLQFEMTSDGKHVMGGKTYKKGDIVRTHKDLANAFPDRFRPYEEHRHVEEEESEEETPRIKVKTKGSGKTSDKTTLEARGADVTAKFPKVDGKLLQVFKRGESYHVYEKDSPTPLNKEGLERDEVSKFAKKYLNE